MDSAAPRGPDRWLEWPAVPQEPDHGKHGHSAERTIYEEGTWPLQVDYCSITIDGGDDMLRSGSRILHGSNRSCSREVSGGSTNQEVGRREELGDALMAVRHQQGLVPQKEVSACGMQLLANVPAAGNKLAGIPVGGAVKVCEKGKHKVLRSSLGQ